MRAAICCEHNECPDRPRWFRSRFLVRPWRCPQCGQWWYIRLHTTYDGSTWEWERCDTEKREYPADRARREKAEREAGAKGPAED